MTTSIVEGFTERRCQAILLKTGALQSAILNSANFSSIATDANGVIQIFNVGAERMLGYAATDVINKITPADISDPQELIAHAEALSAELGTTIAPGIEALVFKASRGIEDIYELTYIRQDGTRFPAVVSVTALRDELGTLTAIYCSPPTIPLASRPRKNCTKRQFDWNISMLKKHCMQVTNIIGNWSNQLTKAFASSKKWMAPTASRWIFAT